MDGKLKLPPLPKQQRQENSYLIEDKDGFLVNVPESRLEDWEEDNEPKLSDKFISQAVADLKRKLMER